MPKKVPPYRSPHPVKKLIRPKKFPIKPELFDVDLMKPERIHGGFCSCGRRMDGEAMCAHCMNDLDFDEAYS